MRHVLPNFIQKIFQNLFSGRYLRIFQISHIFSSLQNLPWEECNYDYNMDYHCQDIEFCYGQMCENGEDRSSRPSYQFWHYYVMSPQNGTLVRGQNIYESGLGYPKWDLLIALYLGTTC